MFFCWKDVDEYSFVWSLDEAYLANKPTFSLDRISWEKRKLVRMMKAFEVSNQAANSRSILPGWNIIKLLLC